MPESEVQSHEVLRKADKARGNMCRKPNKHNVCCFNQNASYFFLTELLDAYLLERTGFGELGKFCQKNDGSIFTRCRF